MALNLHFSVSLAWILEQNKICAKMRSEHSLDAPITETCKMWRCYLEQAKNFVSN